MAEQSDKGRTPEEILADVQKHRAELAEGLEHLREEVETATDWRRILRAHRKELLIGAVVAGFVLGGGLGAIGGLFRRAQ